LVQDRGLQVLVAIQEDVAVGTLAGSIESVPWSRYLYGSLHLIYVDPAARKLGVARSLATSFAKEVARHGCSEVWLDVMAQNREALEYWHRIGFELMWRSMRISVGQLSGESDECGAEEPLA
jgi:ribosomal protein S18 acetylase RimI-like enzyme